MKFFMRVLTGWIVLSIAVDGKEFAPRKEGLYAVIETSRGRIVAQLEFQLAPRTVANFMGLAEGSRPWFDLEVGELVQRPFYDGLEIHRILPKTLVQMGSRNGQGNDGPGYWLADEFHPSLKHNRPGILSMANRGPDTNGSQFFIILKSMNSLNGKHSVFGRVVLGQSRIDTIGEVTLRNNRPRKPIFIESIRFVRSGVEAEGFDPADYPAPEGVAELVLIGE